MTQKIDLSKFSQDDILAALQAMLTKDPASAGRVKSMVKGVSSPRAKQHAELIASLGEVKKNLVESVTPHLKGRECLAITFIIDKWDDSTDATIEVSSAAGVAPQGKRFQSQDGKFYTSRHEYIRVALKSHVMSAYAKGQTGKDTLSLVDLPNVAATVTPPAKK